MSLPPTSESVEPRTATAYLALPARRPISPLLTIWTQPRQTAEHVDNHSAPYAVPVLAMLSGLSTWLYLANRGAAADKVPYPIALVIILVGGPLLGLARVYMGGLVMLPLARLLGGSATFRSARVALAWGAVPEVAALLMQLVSFAILGPGYLSNNADPADSGFYAAALGEKAVPYLAVWAVVCSANCISQLCHISGARGLIAYAISVLLGAVAFIAPLLLLMFVTTP